jgi:hypothetical protein
MTEPTASFNNFGQVEPVHAELLQRIAQVVCSLFGVADVYAQFGIRDDLGGTLDTHTYFSITADQNHNTTAPAGDQLRAEKKQLVATSNGLYLRHTVIVPHLFEHKGQTTVGGCIENSRTDTAQLTRKMK